MVLTNVNKFVVIIFGVVVLGDQLTLLSGLGVALAMGGGLWYGKARARMQEFTAATVAQTGPVGHEHGDKESKELAPLMRDVEAARDEEAALRKPDGSAHTRVPHA